MTNFYIQKKNVTFNLLCLFSDFTKYENSFQQIHVFQTLNHLNIHVSFVQFFLKHYLYSSK